MVGWLHRLFGAGRSPGTEELLNEGLALAMDWGENWLAPIQERLHRAHPRLEPQALDAANATCQEAMRFGHETAYAMALEEGQNVRQDVFTARLLARYPWVSAENAARLFGQSTYYVWKAGGPARPDRNPSTSGGSP
jgi:hypothetical protein